MTLARSMLCPVVVGRDDELAVLRSAVERATAGRGGVAAIVAEAGVGKSRLSRELLAYARERQMTVLSGRAVAGDTSVPYRPLTEALLGCFRSGGRPTWPELEGFEGHLGRLVPTWRDDTERGADESPVLLGEAVCRVLRVLARPAGAVVLFEDLHWADVETMAVVEYLADALVDEAVLCVVTSRPEGAADLVGHLRRHPEATTVELAPLTVDEIGRLVAASVDDDAPPTEVVDFVAAHSEGNPFLAEELLAGLSASGTLAFDGGWRVTGPLTPVIPTDVAHSIRARMADFSAPARRVLGSAAVLGRYFDWNLLPGIAEVDGTEVVEALRLAVGRQLVEVDGQGFRFRHMLTREAILADLLPPERSDLSLRAWPAVEHAHPGLPGSWCELVAELAEASGDPVAAARLLVVSARRALSSGALATAQVTADRARVLGAGSTAGLDAEECFVQVTSLAGKPAETLVVGRPLVARMEAEGVAPERLVGLLVVLARAAVAAGDVGVAAGFVERAQVFVRSDHLEALGPGVAAVAAHVALDSNDLEGAEALARTAVDAALEQGQPAVACEALEVLGRVNRTRSAEDSMSAFERAAGIAETHGLTGWLLRARHELALERWVDGDTSGLRETRELAARHGAMVTVAVMDLSLADIALAAFERDECLERAQACVEASRRFGLATLSVAELWLAGGHALAGDDSAMEEALARARQRDPNDPRILGDLWGRVRATRSMVRDDRQQVRADLDRMMEYVAVAPVATSIYPNRLLWVVLSSVDDDDLGASAQRHLEGLSHLDWWTSRTSVLQIASAITLGRQGRTDEAAALGADGLLGSAIVATAGGSIHYINLVLAETQIRDGWGEPATLLRRAEAFFGERGFDAIARRARVALGLAGEKMPRRGRGDSVVPEHLRAAGITSREVDVLMLVVEGCSNREIADRLHLSPKTVERHMASLFRRTGVGSRDDLATWVARSTN